MSSSSLKIVFAVVGVFAVIASIQAQSKYTNKFDGMNIDNILGNGRILQNYIKCLLEKGPCTSEGRELKRLLPDALATDCSKCTEVQRKNSNKVITYLRTHKASDWEKLLSKYDPNGAYMKKYGSLIAN